MKKFYLIILLLSHVVSASYAQEQVGFKYKFRPTTASGGHQGGLLRQAFRIERGHTVPAIAAVPATATARATPATPITLRGLFVVNKPAATATVNSTLAAPGTAVTGTIPAPASHQITTVMAAMPETLVERRILSRRLAGSIIKKDGDTLFLSFNRIAYISNAASLFNIPGVVNDLDNGQDFKYIVPNASWRRPFLIGSRLRIKVPFAYTALASTLIPLRVSLDGQGETISDFPAGNISALRVWGYTNIYRKAPLDDATYRVLGVGPFVGPTRTSGTVDGKDVGRLGMVYGLNVVAGFSSVNLVLAVGGEKDWSSVTENISPWIGFGIGVKLVELGGASASGEQ